VRVAHNVVGADRVQQEDPLRIGGVSPEHDREVVVDVDAVVPRRADLVRLKQRPVECLGRKITSKWSVSATFWGRRTPKGRWQIAGLPPGDEVQSTSVPEQNQVCNRAKFQ
jgi:hypothetical protein